MKRRIILILIVFIAVFGLFGILTILSARTAIATTQKAVGAFKLQDLNATKAYLRDATKEFKTTKKFIFVFSPLRIIPLFGWYVADIQRGVNGAIYGLEAASTFAEAITPYADVLGLSGQGTFLGGTAQERLAKAIETLSKVTPQIDAVGESLKKARSQVDQIQSWRYPDFLPAKPGSKIKNIKNSIDQLESFIVDTKPLLLV